MKKARDYFALRDAGFSVPTFGVFDHTCLVRKTEYQKLSTCVEEILSYGSGMIGLRTEPKESALSGPHIIDKNSIFVSIRSRPPKTLAGLGGFPHYMPLTSMNSVVAAMEEVEREFPFVSWWFLVNEAFDSYKWNAVVRVTSKLMLPGGLRLDGEVNFIDNLPLRPALQNVSHLSQARNWYGDWPARLREIIIQNGLLETWIEVSLVLSKGTERLIFWGLR